LPGEVSAYERVPVAEVTLSVTPTDPYAGAEVTVRFEGAPGDRRDWITVAPTGARDDTRLAWAHTETRAGEVRLRVPDEPSELEARFHLDRPEGGTRVIGRSPSFVSLSPAASVDAPTEVGVGAAFAVPWEGPDHGNDYLAIVSMGAPEGTHISWTYTNRGNPAHLTAPDEPGEYEVRYATGQENRTLAHAPITVVDASARVIAPAELGVGAAFEVDWQGPNNSSDFVTIVLAGAPEGRYLSWVYTRNGSPVRLTAPSEPGDYAVRYVLGQGGRTLASAPVRVVEAAASVVSPSEVAAGSAFEVDWEGPNNLNDYVTIVLARAPEGRYLSWAFTRNGSPVRLTAPSEPGDYEARYVLGQGGRTLASVPITVR